MTINFISGETIEIEGNSIVGHDFFGVNLHRAILSKINAAQCNFENANLRGAYLDFGLFAAANFSKSILITTIASSSNFYNANFENCKAMYCRFENSDLSKANFNGSDISNANFSNCKLQGAIMTSINSENTIFKDAVYDATTLWNKDFNPIESGAYLLE